MRGVYYVIFIYLLELQNISGELCGGSFVTDSGQMNSPNVSNDGPDDLIVTCEWTIRKENKTIELHVMRMDIEEEALCLENYVSISSVYYCGTRVPVVRILEKIDVTLQFRVKPFTEVPLGWTFIAVYTSQPYDIDLCWLSYGGFRYAGTMSVTETGLDCVDWTLYFSDSIHFTTDGSVEAASNYCRNPYWYIITPPTLRTWCYTSTQGANWEYCDHPPCYVLTGCLDFLPSTEYTGNLTITANGRQCQAWTEQTPHRHKFNTDDRFPFDGTVIAAKNYCRDPNDEGRPWCYTTDPDIEWEFCNFKPCTTDCWNIHLSGNYRGTLSVTANGRSCQPWSSQWPHVHDWFKNDDEFPNDKSVHAAKNYCRDPDLEGRTWCYTMDAQFRWEYCNFPPCYELRHLCGLHFTNAYGVLSSPDLDGDGFYENMVECLWIIEAANNEVIFLRFLEINIEKSIFADEDPCYDYVKVFGQGLLLGTHCGSPDLPRYTSRINMTLLFHSDTSYAQRSGFTATYSKHLIKDIYPCGGIFESDSGSFGQVLDGRFEVDDVNCEWKLIIPNNKPIELKIYRFKITDDQHCANSYLSIYNGTDDTGSFIGNYCGVDPIPIVASQSGQMFVRYHSQGAPKGDGFFATFYTPTQGQFYECEATIYNSSQNYGIFRSPDYDGDGMYEHNIECSWEIVAEPNKIVQLFIFEFDLEEDAWCRFDKMSVYDGSMETRKYIGTYCGKEAPRKFRSSSSVLYINFSTDGSQNAKGFTAGFSYADEHAWRQWPDGNYAIPMSVFGCPDQEINRWKHGYVLQGYGLVMDFVIDGVLNLTIDHEFFHLGEVLPSIFRINYCIKEDNPKSQITTQDNYTDWESQLRINTEWPRGKYDIYMISDDCPIGFQSYHKKRPIEEHAPPHFISFENGMIYKTSPYEQRFEWTRFCYKQNISDTETLQDDLRSPFMILPTSTTVDGSKLVFDKKVMLLSNSSMKVAVGDVSLYYNYWYSSWTVLPNDISRLYKEKTAVPQHYTFWTAGFPTSIYKADGVVCFLYDLGQSVLISGIRFVLKIQNAINMRELKIPTILRSHRKWSFLHHGAWRCLNYTERAESHVDIHCLNEPIVLSTRHLILKESQRSDNALIGLQEGSLSLQFFSNRASWTSSCGHSLGMRDGFIEDFQIWSPSEEPNRPATSGRPGDVGWCPRINDVITPFIQIDLLVPTKIEAVEIFPDRLTLDTNSYTEMHKFRVEFNNLTSLSTSYGRWSMSVEFLLHRRYGYSFAFERPIKTRYVRIYSEFVDAVADEYVRCHTIELIGCLKHGGKNMQCDKSSRNLWLPINREAFPIRYFYSKPREGFDNTNYSSCRDGCNEHGICSVVIGESTCQWYEQSYTYSYSMSHDTSLVFVQIKMCPAGQHYMDKTPLYLTGNTSWETLLTVVRVPGIIVNQGFPFHYLSGDLQLWEISFSESEYVNLVVYNTSFNRNQKGQFANRHFNDWIDRLYIVYDTFDVEYILSDAAVTTVSGIIALYDKETEQQVSHFKLNSKKVRIIWQTFYQEVPRDLSARGFRVLAYSSETPPCSSSEICLWSTAELFSRSFLEELYARHEETWHILASEYRYISLRFNNIHIECSIKSSLIIWVTHEQYKTFCNFNKPIENVKSLIRELTISLLIFHEAHRLPEGFTATYEEASKKDPITLQGAQQINESVYYESTLGKVHTICSQYFGKCYVLLPDLTTMMNISPTSWSLIENSVCSKGFGGTLISLHSKLEQDFVGYVLLHKYMSTNNQYAYIGLYRERSQGMVNKWSDGSPVTFMDWEKNHPSPDPGHRCTRMSLQLAEEHKWESILCNEEAATVGVCQYNWNLETVTTVNNVTHQELDSMWESLTFFICTNKEVISYLGRCNNKTDCYDGSDEYNCSSAYGECLAVQFRCGDGSCISITLVCDHHQDCIDDSDEQCYFPPCGFGEYQCDNQVCIDELQRCDGKIDCEDKSDEVDCVSSNCNDGNSFRCGFTHCITKSFLCDGIADCAGREDEDNCQFPNTCQEWWKAGYHNSGVYDIHGLVAECDFDSLRWNGSIVTRFHNIDVERSFTGVADMSFKYNSEEGLQKLMHDGKCYQSLDQSCQPWVQLLYDSDDSIVKDPDSRLWSWDHIHACTCLRYRTPLSTNFSASIPSTLHDCNGEIFQQHVDSYFHFEVLRSSSYGYIETLKLKDNHVFDVNQLTIKVNPIVCYTDFDAAVPGLACGNGFTTSQANRCLYHLDASGHIVGCRSLNHLQQCEIFDCPADYFKCPQSFCIASRYICDGIAQCPGYEDELNCDEHLCVSQYRCLESSICLSENYICDGVRHCPQGDDEKLCNFRCPDVCRCEGLTVDCSNSTWTNDTLSASISPSTRLLDISKRPKLLSFFDLDQTSFHYLIYLNLSHCQITNLSTNMLGSMRNLLVLDLSNNWLHTISSNIFVHQSRLQLLRLNANMEMFTIESDAFYGLGSLSALQLTHHQIDRILMSSFVSLTLEKLEIYHSVIQHIDGMAFEQLRVKSLFLNTTVFESVSADMFQGLESLQFLVTDEFSLCCIKPDYLDGQNCLPHSDAFSSCSDLMRNEVLRALIWVIGIFSLFGNSASFLYYLVFEREKFKLGYGMFVSNLAISDFLMGAYLIIIAGTDMYYRGDYSMYDKTWKSSPLCKFAGTIAALSNETSILFIGLITLDRVLVVKYPFGDFRIDRIQARVLTAVAWSIGLGLSLIPFVITSYFGNEFYSKSGVCLALPLTKQKLPGWEYSICVFIGLNFLLTLLIILGQWMIYHEVMATKLSLANNVSSRKTDLKIARNLLFVALTDLLCWFPVGLLGILALTDLADISAEVYAWIAVLVLPINSAINPFLYTLSAIAERKRQKRRTSMGTKSTKSNIMTFPEAEVEAWFRLFRKARFFNERTEGFVPIASILDEQIVDHRQCVQIMTGVLKCLFGLHARGLTQEKLVLEDVYVKKRAVGFVVSLNCRPQPAIIKKKMKTADSIKRFGDIFSILLNQCERKL